METKSTPTAIVRVIRPELTDEERARRMAAIEKAAANLIVATMRNKRRVTA